MKLPGEAMLEFRVEKLNESQCILHQIALFKPRGLFGLIYWYLVMPFHAIVFGGMLAGLASEAIRVPAVPPPAPIR